MDVDASVTPSNYVIDALTRFAGFDEAEAVVDANGRHTYADLAAAIVRMAEVLRQHGIQPGDGVAALIGNPAEAVVLQFALHLLGCRSAWISPDAPGKLSTELLAIADVRAFVYDARAYPDLGERIATSAADLTAFCLGSGGVGADLAAQCWSAPRVVDAPIVSARPWSLFQTSGTTGRPKLVQHEHEFFVNLSDAARRYLDSGAPPMRHLSVSTYGYPSSQATALIVLLAGGLLVLHERFDAGQWLATVERERITSASLQPPRLCDVLDHPALASTDTSSLATLSCHAGPLSPTRFTQSIERLGPVVLIAYGMSEAILIAAYPAAEHDRAYPQRLASCGKPPPAVRVQVRGPDGSAVAVGEVGEVWTSLRLMTTGYWGEPELTAQTVVDGWLRTGDLGYLDPDGYLYLVDRVKDMIVTGEMSTNVYSRRVEDTLNAYPGVRASAVIGVPHPRYGEAVHAIVELASDASVTPQALREWAVSELNELWAPLTVEMVPRLPVTSYGKIDKNALRESRRVPGRTDRAIRGIP